MSVLKAIANGGNTGGGGGGGGVTSLNSETGDITLTSSGATITITKPTSTTINLETNGGGSVAFSALTSGTNTTAAMVVGTGASIAPSGSGAITATIAPAGTLTGTTLAPNVITSSLTTVGTIGTGVWQGTKINLAYGGTNADLSGTGGASQVLKQSTSGAAITVGQLAASDLSNGTTGSGAVVLASAPTMSNPVVGTQSQADNSTKAASTAYVDTAIAGKVSTTLTNTHILVGNSSNVATDVAMSGDATLANTGAITLKNTGTAGTYGKVTTDAQGRITSGATNDVAHGGTGLTTLTANSVLLGEGTGNIAFATTGTSGRLLIDQGAAADPSFNAMSGDIAITNAGVTTIQSNAVTTTKINNAAVTYAKIQNEGAVSLLGNPTGSPASPSEITLGSGLSFSGTTLTAKGSIGLIYAIASGNLMF